ncbi:Ig-like domain-containing protein [Dietzia sp. WMMA184]|uniref:L,D-transpeptidase n=1 Tax=Dietzia sp. WMMA184 TaxID=2039808 RepID=UPI0020B151B5|nr:Ig-like domain-containing protein [Dietzia sp. WMMA184]
MAVFGLGACTVEDAENDAQADQQPVEVVPAAIATSYEDAESQANPSEPIVLDVTDGVFDEVTATNEQGREVEGAFNEERTTWRTTETLGYNRTYSIEATATGAGGEQISDTSSFSTIVPGDTANASLVTGQETTVGIGQPVAVLFDKPIKDRRAAEAAIEVTTTPEVEGAFYWVSQSEVRWRPARYWDPGTEVTVDVNIYGAHLGGDLYGAQDTGSDFSIGDAVVTTIDDDTKMMTTTVNGEVTNSVPVSLGKSSTPTPNGVYYVSDKHASMIMDSSTFGVPVDSPEGYRTPVDWATRISYSGIFVHGAPWSVWAQGNTNVSNGCINATNAEAKWFYDNHTLGDVVEVVNTVGPTLEGTDGLGDWNIPWQTWKTGNADQL